MRARLIAGDYGRPLYRVKTSVDEAAQEKTQEVVTDLRGVRAPEILRLAVEFQVSSYQSPEVLLVENNMGFRDQTQANRIERASFQLFEGVASLNAEGSADTGAQPRHPRALYLGFDRDFSASPLSLYVDAEDQPGEVPLRVELLTAPVTWSQLAAVEDQTRGFQQPGFLSVVIDQRPAQGEYFGKTGYWLRVRPELAADRLWEPRLRTLQINAGPAVQLQSVTQELLGSSTGEPRMRFVLSQTPVLPDSLELRVREGLTDDELEVLRAQPGPGELPRVAEYPEFPPPGHWVLWERVDSFLERADPDARVYRLNT